MKSLFLTFTFLTTTLAFGQSMLILKTGKIFTIDQEGMVFDLNQFILPYQIKHMGGRYFIDQDRKMRTVDVGGILYTKEDEDKTPRKIEHLGENYFISNKGNIYTVSENGFIFEAGKDRGFRNIHKQGGNFFIAEKEKEDDKAVFGLFVITNAGKIVEVTVEGLDPKMISVVGGKYFTTRKGELYTISDEGFVYSKSTFGRFNGLTFKKGLNYFFTGDKLYLVTSSGVLLETGATFGSIKHYGTNFFVTFDNKLFTVSSSGVVKNMPFEHKYLQISQFSHL